jgi:hypothetical protein
VNWRWPHPVCPGSPNSNAWSARQRAAASHHGLPPTLPRAPHGVPGQIDVRAHLAAHGSVVLGGAALAIETGAGFAIGPSVPLSPPLSSRVPLSPPMLGVGISTGGRGSKLLSLDKGRWISRDPTTRIRCSAFVENRVSPNPSPGSTSLSQRTYTARSFGLYWTDSITYNYLYIYRLLN